MKYILPALLAIIFCGCSLNKTAARVTAGIVDDGINTVFSQDDIKYVESALPANLQLIEILIANDSKNKKLLTNAAMGFCGYALMFLEDENPSRASAFYLKGQNYAQKALYGKQLEKLRKKDAPALFWQTFCKASYLNLNKHKPASIAELSTLEPAINKLEQLNSTYYYNGAYILKGAYYAIRPRMFGGDPSKAKDFFEKALTGNGKNFLITKFEYAKMAATADLDEELFDKLLNEILEAKLENGPERLANEIAKIKAKKLLEQKDEIF